MKYTVLLPSDLRIESSLEFAKSLVGLPEADEYYFDFSKMGRIEPFALLYLSSQIYSYRNAKPNSRFVAINYERCQYAAHMGFFKAFGLDHGNAPGEAAGSSTYIPITILHRKQVNEEALFNKVAPAQVLENKAKEMAAILTQSNSGSLFQTLVYSIREILRNVFEHSMADQVALCAQYWASLNRVSLSIIDHGIGIREGLAPNPYLEITNDLDALHQALLPGVSGKSFQGSYKDPDDAWSNSGYGLYMTSSLCKEAGAFFIASGTHGLYLSEKNERVMDLITKGTAINITLMTNKLRNLEDMLEQYRGISCDIAPSKSSRGLMS